MYTKKKVEQIISKQSKFNLLEILDNGFTFGFRSIGWLLLLGVIVIVYMFLLGKIPPFIIADINVVQFTNSAIVMSGLSAGVIIFFNKGFKGKKFDFLDIFKGYTTNYGNMVGYVVLSYAFNYILGLILKIILGNVLSEGGGEQAIVELFKTLITNFESFFGLALVGALVGAFIQVSIFLLLIFTPYFIAVGRMNIFDSIFLSIKLSLKCFFWLFLLLIIVILFNLLGVLLLGLGLIITIPVTFAIFYAVFHNMIDVHLNDNNSGLVDMEDVLDVE